MILIRLAELTLKSKFVRVQMRKRLLNYIISKIKEINGNIVNIEIEGGRIFVELKDEKKEIEAVKVLRYLSGIASVSFAYKCSFDNLTSTIIEKFGEKMKGRRVNIDVRKVSKVEKSSLEIRNEIVSKLRKKVDFTFDYKNFEYSVNVEIREKFCLVFDNIYKSLYGIPYGFEGKAISLFSGGVDSFLATLLAIRRGIEVILLHIDLGSFWSEKSKERVNVAIKEIKKFIPKKLKVYFVNAEEIHKKYYFGREQCIFCKLLMHYIAKKIALKEKAKAIITGEVIGQVASQTLENLSFYDEKVPFLKIRPLIGLTKNEIIEKFKEYCKQFDINFEEINKDVGKCSLLPKKPKIKPKLLYDFDISKISFNYKVIKV